MPKQSLHTYVWTGTNNKGEKLKGEQTAKHKVLLKIELKQQGITPKRIRKKIFPSLFIKQPNQEEIRIFTRQLATMTQAGISLLQTLELIEKSQAKISMKALITKIKTTIESGAMIAAALRHYSHFFNALYCDLIAVGEHSGTLDLMFERVATYQEKIHALKSKIKKALFYPVAVIVVAILVTIGLLIFVVPQFEALFSGFGAQLPYPTQVIIHCAHFLEEKSGLLVILFTVLLSGFITAKKRSEKLATYIDSYVLRLPVLGNVIQKAIIARFARTLATTFAAGLPLIDALQAVASAAGNRIYTQAILSIREHVIAGQTLHHSLRQTGLFPNMVIQMLAMGETSGTLEVMLNKLAAIFEAEVDQVVDNLTDLLEPIIMLILGVLIGGLVIAMYLPIFRLGSVV